MVRSMRSLRLAADLRTLLVAGAAGFIIGPAWQWPGMLLLVAGGLAVAADR